MAMQKLGLVSVGPIILVNMTCPWLGSCWETLWPISHCSLAAALSDQALHLSQAVHWSWPWWHEYGGDILLPPQRKSGELALPHVCGSTGWSSLGRAEALTLVVQIRESQRVGQINCHPGPDPGP